MKKRTKIIIGLIIIIIAIITIFSFFLINDILNQEALYSADKQDNDYAYDYVTLAGNISIKNNNDGSYTFSADIKNLGPNNYSTVNIMFLVYDKKDRCIHNENITLSNIYTNSTQKFERTLYLNTVPAGADIKFFTRTMI